METIDVTLAEIVGAAALAVAILALLVGLTGRAKLRWMSRSYKVLDAGVGQSLVEVVSRHREAAQETSERTGSLERSLEKLSLDLEQTVSGIGLVRYDAFADIGGRLSFSAAFLNGMGNGVVVSSINGRSETRIYAKAVASGGSEHNLSAEEQQAVDEAVRQSVRRRELGPAAKLR